jgi:hypothetical protein
MAPDTNVAALRIEVRRTGSQISIVVIDPKTTKEIALVEDVSDERIRRVNKFLWHQLSASIGLLKSDPIIHLGGALSFELYRLGQAALIQLTGDDNAEVLDEVKSFCATRVAAHDGGSEPPVIEIVSRREDHLPFEVLPLLGRMGPSPSEDLQLEELRRVMPGLAALCVHGVASAPHLPPEEFAPGMLINIFRYDGLEGAMMDVKRLRGLEGRRLRIESVYPPRGYKPPPDFPELELVRAVTRRRRWRESMDEQVPIAHFTCHVSTKGDQAVLRLRPDSRFGGAGEVPYKLHEIEVAADYVDKPPPSAPLLFLSACRSGAVDELTYTSAARALARIRPRALVGALADLPSMMAAEFAESFYRGLREGESVGGSLHSARGFLLKKPYTNPLGLLFVSYFGETVRVTKRKSLTPVLAPPSTYTTL